MMLAAECRKVLTTIEAVFGVLIFHPKFLADDPSFEM
jgi:hypothetical protein